MTSGGARGTASQEIRPGADFEIGDFVHENLGGRMLTEEAARWTHSCHAT